MGNQIAAIFGYERSQMHGGQQVMRVLAVSNFVINLPLFLTFSHFSRIGKMGNEGTRRATIVFRHDMTFTMPRSGARYHVSASESCGGLRHEFQAIPPTARASPPLPL